MQQFDGDVVETVEQSKGSPLYQRYAQLQCTYPTSVIAMRLGDFYEIFGEKATIVADELDLTLTSRDCGLNSRVPMCGFPYHVAEECFVKINARHDLVIVESNDDKNTRYLPKTNELKPSARPNSGEIAIVEDELITKLKDLVGVKLEVKL